MPILHHPPLRWERVVASTYGVGDGFLGGSLACPDAGRLDAHRHIVASRTLACGTLVAFRLPPPYRRRATYAYVADRGPFVAGRTFDLGPGTVHALRVGDYLGVILWRPLGRLIRLGSTPR